MKELNKLVPVILFILNISALYSQDQTNWNFLNRILGQNGIQNEKSIQRLSSGTLLWSDDPATMAIYEQVKTHIDYLSINIRNQNDMTSYYQSRDGYLDVMVNSLQRIRELILMRSNGIYNSYDREIIDSEISYHYNDIIKSISRAQFNTKPLFASFMDENMIQNRFMDEEFYNMEGLDRILNAVIAERAYQGAILNTLSLRREGQSIEQLNSSSFPNTSFNLELSNLKRNEILFFSNLFLLQIQE